MRVLRSGQFIVAAGLAVLFVGGCGDDDGNAGGADATEITVEAGDFNFKPLEWQVAADTDVTVTLENEGLNEHEWAVLTLGTEISSEDEFIEDIVELEIEKIDPDTSDSITINLPAGTYQVICALDGHFDAGMEGTLTVGA